MTDKTLKSKCEDVMQVMALMFLACTGEGLPGGNTDCDNTLMGGIALARDLGIFDEMDKEEAEQRKEGM